MATNLLTFRPAVIQASAHSSTDLSRRKASPNWWNQIFGWSSEPDYIEGEDHQDKKKRSRVSESDLDPQSFRSRFSPGCFTEEKARQLRMTIMDSETHHNAMYHSAIASRLASDFSSKTKNLE